MMRKPVATANWKMEMTVEQGLAYLQHFRANVSSLLDRIDVILCPPFTALYPLASALAGSPIQLGVQNLSVAERGAYTGEISAILAADAGARWAQLGHWELRRHRGETDQAVNHKVHRALAAGLKLILLVGEARDISAPQAFAAVEEQLSHIMDGCRADQIARMIFVYEPEWTIGADEPAPVAHIESGCAFIRSWLADRYGRDTARSVRMVYGGSVSPAFAPSLVALPNLDGLGAGRKGRDPDAFADIVRLIVEARSPSG
jgi:triosephosphate isomerase